MYASLPRLPLGACSASQFQAFFFILLTGLHCCLVYRVDQNAFSNGACSTLELKVLSDPTADLLLKAVALARPDQLCAACCCILLHLSISPCRSRSPKPPRTVRTALRSLVRPHFVLLALDTDLDAVRRPDNVPCTAAKSVRSCPRAHRLAR